MEKCEEVKDVARLQKFFENPESTQISSLRKPNGTFTRNSGESFAFLLETHFPDCEVIEEERDWVETLRSDREKTPEEIEQILECTKTEKIEWAIESFSPYKATGQDQIFPGILQKAKKIVAPILQILFRSSLMLGYVPKAWRGTLVTFLPKAGKDDYANPKAYRPISLMSFILKTLEKLIDKRIRNIDLEAFPLNTNQHAYRAPARTRHYTIWSLLLKKHFNLNKLT